MITRPFTGPLADSMARGHLLRTGHALDAELVSADGELWTVSRSCCGTPTR